MNAFLYAPSDVILDTSGNLYIADTVNSRIRQVNLASAVINTVVGDGTAGYVDNDDPTMAEFYGVEGLDVSPDGTRIVVADGNNGDTMPFNHVRIVTP